jgi:hypothetical protein
MEFYDRVKKAEMHVRDIQDHLLTLVEMQDLGSFKGEVKGNIMYKTNYILEVLEEARTWPKRRT